MFKMIKMKKFCYGLYFIRIFLKNNFKKAKLKTFNPLSSVPSQFWTTPSQTWEGLSPQPLALPAVVTDIPQPAWSGQSPGDPSCLDSWGPTSQGSSSIVTHKLS